MSELSVGTISGLAANGYVVDVASGSTLDVTNATGTLPSAQLPAGSVLQVVSTTKTDTFSVSAASGSYNVVTGLNATITPTSTNSKVLVIFHAHGAVSSNSQGQAQFRIMRDATPVGVATSVGNRGALSAGTFTEAGASYMIASISASYLDSPNTTSSITYSAQFYNSSSSTQTLYVNRSFLDSDTVNYSRTTSGITLMEVAG